MHYLSSVAFITQMYRDARSIKQKVHSYLHTYIYICVCVCVCIYIYMCVLFNLNTVQTNCHVLEVCHPRCVCENWKGYVVKHNYVN